MAATPAPCPDRTRAGTRLTPAATSLTPGTPKGPRTMIVLTLHGPLGRRAAMQGSGGSNSVVLGERPAQGTRSREPAKILRVVAVRPLQRGRSRGAVDADGLGVTDRDRAPGGRRG